MMRTVESRTPRSSPWLAWLVLTICILPLLYLASYGPVLRMTAIPFDASGRAWTNPQWVRVLYKPANNLAKDKRGFYHGYIGWWMLPRENRNVAQQNH